MLGIAGLLARRSPIGVAMGLAGLALLARASSRLPARGMGNRGNRGDRGQPIDIEKTIRIDADPEQVFDLFTNYENFPRFMSNVVQVRDLGERRAQWVVKGPAGTELSWNAVLTEHSRPHRLAWESEAGADVAQSGSLLFEAIPGGTRVTVRMSYRQPAGAEGHAMAELLGKDPRRRMDQGLAHMKSLVERGAIGKAGAMPGGAAGNFFH
jgi:uncharacterized membrane protein